MPGEKTEKATPKRRQDERKKGNVFQSKEIVTVSSMIALFFVVKLLGPFVISQMQDAVSHFIVLAASQETLTQSDLNAMFLKSCTTVLLSIGPIMAASILIAIAITMAQTKGLVSSKGFEFKFSKLNPLKGIKNMFSLRGLIELLKSIIKIVVLGIIIYNVLADELPLLPRLMDMSSEQAIAIVGNIIFSIVKMSAIIFAFLAAFDYMYQWWEYEKNLRMSKEDIKEEYKNTEGDPQIKGKIKQKQQAMSRRRMMQQVPTADVVIRNPTHFAVALKYEALKSAAPVVVAKGADSLALKIVAIAEENGVYVMENRPLARALYANVELEEEIPDQFYQAVAEVLAFVYSLKKKD